MNTELSYLKEMSFNVITKYFSRFVSASLTTTDKCFKKHLSSLQRAYSSAILTKLLQIGSLDKQHVEFLLNEYLKEIDVGLVLKYLNKEETVQRIKSIGHSLNELSAKKEQSDFSQLYSITHTIKALVPFARNVTKMLIPHICDDELLKLIAANCSYLSELDISESRVSGDGLQAFSKIQTKCLLKILHLSKTKIYWDDIGILLKNVPSLQVVDSVHLPKALYSIHQEDADNTSEKIKIYDLINLDFSFYNESPMLTNCLSLCSKLCPLVRKLVVPVTKGEDLEAIYEFLELDDVTINSCRIIIDINPFLSIKGRKLKSLTVNSCVLSMSSLISDCINLEMLVFKNVQFEKPSENISNSLSRLKCLELDLIDFYDSNCVESIALLLNSSPNLENLSLCGSFINSEIKSELSTFYLNCGLKCLSFDCSDVEINWLEQIVLNCNSLKKLSLKDCRNITSCVIEDFQHAILASNRSIEIIFSDYGSEMSFSDNFDDDDDFEINNDNCDGQILFVKGHKFKYLTVNLCTLSMPALISNCINLESLFLKYMAFHKPSKNYCGTLPFLRNLKIEQRYFDDSYYVESVALLLNSSPDLKSLSLIGCFMDSEISAELITFSSNCYLDCVSFTFTDVNVGWLTQFVLNCQSLEKLSLKDCILITSGDIEVFKNALSASNRSIKIIFSDNQSESDHDSDGYDDCCYEGNDYYSNQQDYFEGEDCCYRQDYFEGEDCCYRQDNFEGEDCCYPQDYFKGEDCCYQDYFEGSLFVDHSKI